jgi:hypothetical protein
MMPLPTFIAPRHVTETRQPRETRLALRWEGIVAAFGRPLRDRARSRTPSAPAPEPRGVPAAAPMLRARRLLAHAREPQVLTHLHRRAKPPLGPVAP